MLWNTHHCVLLSVCELENQEEARPRTKTTCYNGTSEFYQAFLQGQKAWVYKASNLPHSPAGLVDTLGEPL